MRFRELKSLFTKGAVCLHAVERYVDREGRTQYSDICHPITAEARTELIDTVKEAYEQALEEQQTEEEAEEEAETEVQGQGQSQQM